MTKSAAALVRELTARLRAAGRPHRAGSVDGHSASSMEVLGMTVPEAVESKLTVVGDPGSANTPESKAAESVKAIGTA